MARPISEVIHGRQTGRELLNLHGQLFGLSHAEAVERAEELLALVELEAAADRVIKGYSGGMQRRLDLAAALVHQPRVLFLDEPTTGLDPASRLTIWEELRRINERGTTVFLTTHYLDEADALADRILVIDRGRIVASDTPDNLKSAVSGDLVDLEVVSEEQVPTAREKLATIADSVEVRERHVRGRVPRAGKAVPGLLRDLEAAGVSLDSIEVARPTLDDVFLTLTGRSLRDAEAATEQPTPEGGTA